MELEALKQAWDEAKAKAEAEPTNKELQSAAAQAQKAYEDAKAADPGDDPDDTLDETKLDAKTKKYLEKIRKEAATHRVKAKDVKSQLAAEQARLKAVLKAAGIETDDDKPEEKLKQSESQKNQLAFRNAILESAFEHGIPKESVKYYSFLVSEATSELEEGEELSDEKMVEIVAECKKKASGKSAGATSTVNDGKGTPNPNQGKDTVTLAEFAAMGTLGKSQLYLKNPTLYEALWTELKAKKKAV